MNLIVKHRVITEAVVNHWFLRGISESGKFYGEIRVEDANSRRAFKWSGELSSTEATEVQEIATRLTEDFEAPDLSKTGAWETSVWSGRMGSGDYRRLALIDVDGQYFPESCNEFVDRLIVIFVPYANDEFMVPISSG